MATSSSSLCAAPYRGSLSDLSSELLALILEQLRNMDRTSAASARCLSRRLDAIATPIVFKTLYLTERIVCYDTERLFPNLLWNISVHTNHVVARSDLNPEGIRRILDGVQRLFSVQFVPLAPLNHRLVLAADAEQPIDLFSSWRYVDADFKSRDGFWLPSDVLGPPHVRSLKTRLYVQDLPLRDFTGPDRDTYLRAIPADFLVSLKLASPAPPLSTRLDSLKRLVLQSRRLETFHYEDKGQGTRFSFDRDERLPAFRELALKSYDWAHTSEEVKRHWDFSKLESLQLLSVPIYNFLSSIQPGELANLKKLVCEDWSAHLHDKRREATLKLYLLVKRHIKALRTLSVTCHTQQFNLDAILAHGPTLQEFSFRDHVGFRDNDRRCPTLHPSDIVRLANGLPYVHTLELDLDARQCNGPDFLRAVCTFPSLHTLTLHVQTVLHPLDEVEQDTDRDFAATSRTYNDLLQWRKEFSGPRNFRRVIINVGGWRPVMVRRLGQGWRRQNQMGIFAERCFVLEGDGSSCGMVVREERCVEGRVSPEPTEYESNMEL